MPSFERHIYVSRFLTHRFSFRGLSTVPFVSSTLDLSSFFFHIWMFPQPSYKKIRNKPHPWNCADCTLLDTACFAKCKAEREG